MENDFSTICQEEKEWLGLAPLANWPRHTVAGNGNGNGNGNGEAGTVDNCWASRRRRRQSVSQSVSEAAPSSSSSGNYRPLKCLCALTPAAHSARLHRHRRHQTSLPDSLPTITTHIVSTDRYYHLPLPVPKQWQRPDKHQRGSHLGAEFRVENNKETSNNFHVDQFLPTPLVAFSHTQLNGALGGVSRHASHGQRLFLDWIYCRSEKQFTRQSIDRVLSR